MINNKTILAMALGLILGACGKLEGTLKVNEAFNVNQGSEKLYIVPGDYKATVSAGTSSPKLTIKGTKAKIKLPKNDALKNLWSDNELYLTAAQIGQEFDVKIVLTNDFSSGSEQRGTESCVYDTYQDREYVCRTESRVVGSREVCKEKNGKTICHTEYTYRNEEVCNWETRTVTIYGERDYAGYTAYESRGGTVSIIKANTVVARMFDKGASRSGFVRTYTGPCRR